MEPSLRALFKMSLGACVCPPFLTRSLSPPLLAPRSSALLHFQISFPHAAAAWCPADQEVLAFTVMAGEERERMRKRKKASFPITPAKIPEVNLTGPA